MLSRRLATNGEIDKMQIIIVMVNKVSPELKNKIPARLEGVDVKVEETVEITPF